MFESGCVQNFIEITQLPTLGSARDTFVFDSTPYLGISRVRENPDVAVSIESLLFGD
jgi:hypothetical protein